MNEQEKQAFLDSLNAYPGTGMANLEARVAYQQGWLKGYDRGVVDYQDEILRQNKK